jgi:hypothetical protein
VCRVVSVLGFGLAMLHLCGFPAFSVRQEDKSGRNRVPIDSLPRHTSGRPVKNRPAPLRHVEIAVKSRRPSVSWRHQESRDPTSTNPPLPNSSLSLSFTHTHSSFLQLFFFLQSARKKVFFFFFLCPDYMIKGPLSLSSGPRGRYYARRNEEEFSIFSFSVPPFAYLPLHELHKLSLFPLAAWPLSLFLDSSFFFNFWKISFCF